MCWEKKILLFACIFSTGVKRYTEFKREIMGEISVKHWKDKNATLSKQQLKLQFVYVSKFIFNIYYCESRNQKPSYISIRFFLLHNIHYHNLKQWGKKISNFLAKTKWKLKIRTKFNFADSFLQVLNNCSHPCFVLLLGQHDWNRDN